MRTLPWISRIDCPRKCPHPRYRCGLILAPLSVIAIAIVFRKGTETVGTVGGIITMIQMIPLAGVIITTEIALKNNFGENGRRK